jgi:hypothetical protein
MSTNRVPAPVGVVIFLLWTGAAYFGAIGGETTRWLAGPFVVAFILVILITILVDKATVGSSQLRVVHSGPGACAPSPMLSGRDPEEGSREMTLAPSEVVYLEGDRFAPAGGVFSGYRLPGGASVSKRELAQQLYAAAFLAAEQAGTLTLAVRPKRTLLGLRTVQALYADPTGRTNPHPHNSLERYLPRLALRQNEVWRILHELLHECADPYAEAVHLVGTTLADRGLLEVNRSKLLGVFTRTEIHLPERTESLAAGRVSEVQTLLFECQQARPDLWRMLITDIAKGISSRQQQTD